MRRAARPGRARAFVALSWILLSACGSSTELLTAGEGKGETIGLRRAGTLGTGGLGYEVEIASGGELVVSVELTTAFHLVVREVGAGGSTERMRSRIGPTDWDIHDLAVTADGAHAFIASADGTVRGFDLSSGATLLTWHLGAAATAVAVSPDGALIATGSSAGVVCLRRARDGAMLQCVAAHGGPVSGLDLVGGRLASSSWDGGAVLWEVPSLRVIARRQRAGAANAVALAPDLSRVAIARGRLPSRRTPAVARRERAVGPGELDPSASLEIWTPGAGAVSGPGHGGPITAVAWTASGEALVTTSWDRTARLWRAADASQASKLEEFPHLVRDVAIDPRGRFAALAAWSREGRAAPLHLVRLMYRGDPLD